MKNISAQSILSIEHIVSGKNSINVKLDITSLTISGTFNGNKAQQEINAQKLYALLVYIEKLQLPEVKVIPGKPPRGQTKFIINYKDGSTVILGMNLNEAGVTYYELSPDQFQSLTDHWLSL